MAGMKSTPIALLTLGLCLPLLARNKPKPDAAKRNVEWQKEEMCQFVFFAVLEGLYRDGIQNEIVDAIIGEKILKKDDKVKTHFVFRCKLCHATYEAFRTYRNRPAFMQTKGASTFGKGADLLKTHKRAKDGFYLDWSFYGSCQACEAAKDLGKAGF